MLQQRQSYMGYGLLFVLVVLLIASVCLRSAMLEERQLHLSTSDLVDSSQTKLAVKSTIDDLNRRLLSYLEVHLVDSKTDALGIELAELGYVPQPGESISLLCHSEFSQGGTIVHEGCTFDRKRLPKIFRLRVQRSLHDLVVSATATIDVGPSEIKNYSYILGAQPPEIVGLSGIFDGPVSIHFTNGQDPESIIAFTNPSDQPLTINGILSSNIVDRTHIKAANQLNLPGYENFINGPIALNGGVNLGIDVKSPISDIHSSFNALTVGAIRGNPQERIRQSTLEFGNSIDGECHLTVIEEAENGQPQIVFSGSLPDHKVVFTRGAQTVVRTDHSSHIARLCTSGSTFISENDITLEHSLKRGPSGRQDSLLPHEFHVAFVSLNGIAGRIDENTKIANTSHTFGEVLAGHATIDLNQPSLELEASFAAVSDPINSGQEPRPAVYVDPDLFAGSGPLNLGDLVVTGAVIAGKHSGVKIVYADGSQRGFHQGVLRHPGAGFLNPAGTPQGFRSSTSALLSSSVTAIDYSHQSIEELLLAIP